MTSRSSSSLRWEDFSFFKSFLKRFLKTTLSMVHEVFDRTSDRVHAGITREAFGGLIDGGDGVLVGQMAHEGDDFGLFVGGQLGDFVDDLLGVHGGAN